VYSIIFDISMLYVLISAFVKPTVYNFAALFTLLGVVVVARPTFLTGKQEMDESILVHAIFKLMRSNKHLFFLYLITSDLLDRLE